MTERETTDTFVAEVLGDDNRELQLLVARGLFPLPPEQLIPLQVHLAASADEELATAANMSLAGFEPRLVANLIAEEGHREVVAYFASHPSHPVVLEAILRLRAVSTTILRELAFRLPPDLQEILLLRQDAIVEDPGILEYLERNPQMSAYASRRTAEYRQHLLARRPAAGEERDEAAEAAVEEPEAPDETASDADVVMAVLDARQLPAEGEHDEATGLSESQVRSLPVAVKVKLSRGAPRSLRNILIRDKNPMVARAVLHGNVMADSEIEQIANSRAVAEEVLQDIARNRQWIRKYSIAHALVRNPRTQVGTAVRLMSRLSVRDLKNLRRDHNVSEAVRSTAVRLYRIKGI